MPVTTPPVSSQSAAVNALSSIVHPALLAVSCLPAAGRASARRRSALSRAREHGHGTHRVEEQAGQHGEHGEHGEHDAVARATNHVLGNAHAPGANRGSRWSIGVSLCFGSVNRFWALKSRATGRGV